MNVLASDVVFYDQKTSYKVARKDSREPSLAPTPAPGARKRRTSTEVASPRRCALKNVSPSRSPTVYLPKLLARSCARSLKPSAGCLGNADKMKELSGSFDVIIDTSPANADIGPYMDMLKFNGTYCRVGVPLANDHEFKFNYISLIFTQKKIAGSVVTGTRRMKHMLDLTLNDIETYENNPDDWTTKTVKFDKINEVKFDKINEVMEELQTKEQVELALRLGVVERTKARIQHDRQVSSSK